MRKIRQRQAAPQVVLWAKQTAIESMYISAMTVFELELGANLKAMTDAGQSLIFHRWLHDSVIPTFAERILPVDEEIAIRCASLHVPRTRPERDAFIAATALVHRLTIVTRNVKDFETMGVPILNPWQPRPH